MSSEIYDASKQAHDELIEVVRILELGQMGLDESLKYWERGEALAKRCEEHLAGAARRVEAAIQGKGCQTWQLAAGGFPGARPNPTLEARRAARHVRRMVAKAMGKQAVSQCRAE